MRRPPAPAPGSTLHAVLTGAAATIDITTVLLRAEGRRIRRQVSHRQLDAEQACRWWVLVNRAMLGLVATIVFALGVLVALFTTGHDAAAQACQFVVLTLVLTPAVANGYLTVARPSVARPHAARPPGQGGPENAGPARSETS